MTTMSDEDYDDDDADDVDVVDAGRSERRCLRDPRQLGVHGVRLSSRRHEVTPSSLGGATCWRAAAKRTVHMRTRLRYVTRRTAVVDCQSSTSLETQTLFLSYDTLTYNKFSDLCSRHVADLSIQRSTVTGLLPPRHEAHTSWSQQ